MGEPQGRRCRLHAPVSALRLVVLRVRGGVSLGVIIDNSLANETIQALLQRFEEVKRLLALWTHQQAMYPQTREAQAAAVTVRSCVEELQGVLDGKKISCEWYPEDDDGVDTGPECGEQATHVSCKPLSGTPTCPAHKCRCAVELK